jgi:hypothetical protein
MAEIPAQWHVDPSRRYEYRYWDGDSWTGYIGHGGATYMDPLSEGEDYPPPLPHSFMPVPLGTQIATQPTIEIKQHRPWYQKPLFWILILVVGFAVLAIAGQAQEGKQASHKSTAPPAASPPSTTISAAPDPPSSEPDSGASQGFGSQDASGDIGDFHLGPEDVLGFQYVFITVTNHSSERSNYVIEIAIESADESVQYDTTTAVVSGLEPGQTTEAKSLPVSGLPSGTVTISLKTIQRTADF